MKSSTPLYVLVTGLLIALAFAATACSDASNPLNTTGPSMAAPSGLSNNAGARFTTMRESDRAPLGSVGADCASDTPIVTQANGHDGTVDFVARYPYGTSKAEGEVWQRQGTGPTETYRRYSQFEIGDGVKPFPSYTSERMSEEGRYKYRTRRTKCGAAVAIGNWSEFKDFTIGGPAIDSSVEPLMPEPECPALVFDENGGLISEPPSLACRAVLASDNILLGE